MLSLRVDTRCEGLGGHAEGNECLAPHSPVLRLMAYLSHGSPGTPKLLS